MCELRKHSSLEGSVASHGLSQRVIISRDDLGTWKKFKARRRTTLAILLVLVLSGPLEFGLYGEDPKFAAGTPTSAPTNAVAENAKSPEKRKAAAKRQLTGAELYSIHCNRCHQERYPTERTAAQWKTIMLHMQVRANIPGMQARLILQYLQENSGR